jgi:integrase
MLTIKTTSKSATRPKASKSTKGKAQKRQARGAGSIVQLSNGKWQCRVQRFGRDTKRVFDTQAEAVAALETIRRAPTGENAKLGKMRFVDWLERYKLEQAPLVKKHTRDLHDYYIALAKPLLGKIPVASISTMDLREFQSSLLKYSASTQKQVWQFVAAALHRAVVDDVIQANPAAKLEAPKGGRVRKRFAWTREETAKALKVLQHHRQEALIRFMLTTGVRPGEALALRWKDINFTTGEVTIEQTVERAGKNPTFGTPKTETSARTFYIDADTATMLRQHEAKQAFERGKATIWADYGLVFPSKRGTPLDHRSMRRLMAFIAEEANVRHLTPHELRHTYRTLARISKVDNKLVSSRLGHASERTTEIYDHTHQDTREQRSAALPLNTLVGFLYDSFTAEKTSQNVQINANKNDLGTEAIQEGNSVTDAENKKEATK